MYENVKIIADVNGIKYWAAWFAWRVPKYVVYRVFAYDPQKQWYYFKAIKSGHIMCATEKELYTRDFKPFCIDSLKTTYYPIDRTGINK